MSEPFFLRIKIPIRKQPFLCDLAIKFTDEKCLFTCSFQCSGRNIVNKWYSTVLVPTFHLKQILLFVCLCVVLTGYENLVWIRFSFTNSHLM